MKIKVMNKDGICQTEKSGDTYAAILYESEYKPGDKIYIEIDKTNWFYGIQMDDAMGEHTVYFTENNFIYEIPFDEMRKALSPKCFQGAIHYIYVRKLELYEINGCHNLSLNPYDQHVNYGVYPHASANVETRGESVFAARNAIDGITESHSHGIWPYSSWGINMDPNAEIKIDFGRSVLVNQIDLWIRTDFPHDSWWTGCTMEFSDESIMEISLEKTDERQKFSFSEKKIEWIKIRNLIKAQDDSPFPALTQVGVYGKNI